ncbi:MAG: class I SAM-dependent RNA methyltransferase [Alphaproteobacteria bacterium]|nr:class I SAM-dependent RNA methyltransferase [Alphaproteobacteria bacterium]
MIDVLGAQGDGVARAELSGKTVALYIPGALAGERVRVRTRDKRGDGVVAELLDILEPSPHRIQPGCPHFERCGGCALQHLDRRIYGAWKRDRVIHALAQRGFADVCVDDAVLIGEGTRRRVTFTAHGSGKAARVGFNARARHDVVAVAVCPLLAGPLNALIAPLGETLASVLKDGQRARVAATACDNGVDLLIEADGSPDLAAREALAALVRAGHAVRVAWRADTLAPEPIVQEQPPRIDLSGVAVELPPGAFLQASREGEHAIRDRILDWVDGAGRVADLFCGLGSFTMPLAAKAVVSAWDVTEPSVRALERAAGRAGLGGRVAAGVRDLDRQPLEARDLDAFDAIVFDPPRAGAKAQAEHLADARAERIVGVSCNPATFARDARILAGGGYALDRVTPIDQFTHSAHVELAAAFTRTRA